MGKREKKTDRKATQVITEERKCDEKVNSTSKVGEQIVKETPFGY